MVPELHLFRFSSLFATSHARSHFSRDFPSPTTFRPQAFAASRRFAPRTRLRACFIPLPRPGFSLFRGFSPRAATLPHRKERAPMPLFHRRSRTCFHFRRNQCASTCDAPRLRGFYLRKAAFRESGYSPRPRPLPSTVSSPPGPFFSRRRCHLTQHLPLMMFASWVCTRSECVSTSGPTEIEPTLRCSRSRNVVRLSALASQQR
jgi:hypothetical protein